ncbi:MAG: histidinol dehydrogenase [Candidatus Nanopelagicales bacterium]|jgi:histidinol dehydrogenase|nr:histidinol dehydrogenase [Candidatus Nanopelagicales bacterium]
MIRRVDLRKVDKLPRPVVERASLDVDAVIEIVKPIIEDVRNNGDQAVNNWTEKLDKIRPSALRVPQNEIDKALAEMSRDVVSALKEAIKRTQVVHQSQIRQETKTEVVKEGIVSQRFIPVQRVGLYVPGGNAVYPSSVVMNVVPAQVAGVASIAVASPAQKENNGWPNKTILAACKLLGINEIYSAGGAQAIAMFAYGTQSCEPVNLVTGPGNIYVTAAKRLLRGIIGIDSEAGPTEIAILADDTGNASWIAADLISQAEHDVSAASVLVTTSEELALAVEKELAQQVPQTKHSSRIKEALSGLQSAIVIVKDLSQGLAVIDQYAAEHLEIHTRDSAIVAQRVKNAGAIFIGEHAPVSLGDYLAGSNHVLPTGGCACHSSGLSVQTFLRSIQYIEYSKNALKEAANQIRTLSHAEDLPAHGQAVDIRFEKP